MKPFFAYLLRCADGSYHAGHTDDLERRAAEHAGGAAPGDAKERLPAALVWTQEFASRDEAIAAEQRIEGWSQAKKEALIADDRERVSARARSRTGLRPAPPEQGTGDDEVGPPPAPVRPEPVEGLLDGIRRRDRRALAKSITLLESTRPDHRRRADALLNALLPDTGKALRLGISGVPGVGKSTFIETLGLFLIARGHRVAVLAIDPSSSVSGGSILGDKTRMERLSVDPAAYIRPTPASGTLGGVAEKTREAMLVCEAAGHDIVIVETVGVGQSETAVANMTDLFVLLQLPNAGDDLQAIKKGVMEIADLVVVNKADLDPAAAMRAQAQIAGALRVFSFHGRAGTVQARVLLLSALKNDGVEAFWQQVAALVDARRGEGAFERRRREQALSWMWDLIHARLKARFADDPRIRTALPQVLADVSGAQVAPSVAARGLLDLYERSTTD